MAKKIIKTHSDKRSRLWFAHRLKGKVKNVAIKPVRKKKKF